MNPQDLISLIAEHNGLQAKTKYSVEYSTKCPNEITSEGDIPAIYLNFGSRGVELIPDRTTGPGLGRNIPVNPTFESDSGLMIRFTIQQDWTNYGKLNTWIENLTPKGGADDTVTSARYYDDCAKNGQVLVHALTYNGLKACTFTFKEAFPAKILPLELNSEPNSGNLTFDVIFNFREYSIEVFNP
jgi:hypothetical protein